GRGRPWGKRCAAGTPRGRGAGRRPPRAAWETRCVSADRLRDRRRPRGRRAEAGAAGAAGASEPGASGTPGAAGPVEAAGDPGAVWVDGAVGQPQVVGPVGSVWVTGTGGAEEEGAPSPSPRGCERKGRPGSTGHESILELWLKVQAMRAASGCGEGSRVELHPVPAGEGPVERGVPGRASWVETSRAGLTGPWVKGQARAAPGAPGGSAAVGLGAACGMASGLCGRGQAVGLLSGGVPAALGTSSGIIPYLLGRGQALGVPGAMGWPEAVQREMGCGAAPGVWDRGQPVQVPGALVREAVCGDTAGLWGRGQAARVPDAVGAPRGTEEEATSVGALGMWWRRRAVEGAGSGGVPGVWGAGRPVGVPCAVEEEARCGADAGFRERGQSVWVETGSGGDPGSWAATQTTEVGGRDEQEVGSGGAPGLWGMGPGMGVPLALGKETGCGNLPGLWATEQPVGVSQAVVVPPGAPGEQVSYGGLPGQWERQQALGVPLADAVAGLVGEDTGCGHVVSLWEGRPAMGEQEALVPTALGVPGPADREAGCGDGSCACRRRQAVGWPEPEGMPKAAVLPKHRCAPAGVSPGAGTPGPGRVPAAVWVSGPVCQEGGSRDVLNLWERIRSAAVPVTAGVPAAPEELWSVHEDTGSAAFPGSWGRRQAVGVPEAPGLVGEETDPGGVPRSWGRRPSARAPGAAEVPTAARVPGPLGSEAGPGGFSGLPGRRQTAGVSTAGGVPVAPRTPRPVPEESAPGGVAGLWGERETARGPADAWAPTRLGVPSAARMPALTGERLGPGGPSGLLGGRWTAEMPAAAGLSVAVGASGPMVANASSGDASGVWGQRPVMEVPAAAGAAGPADGAGGSDGVSGPWRRRASGPAAEALRAPVSLGVLAAVGVPTAGHAPAAVWVTGCTGEETAAAASGLPALRRQSLEGASGAGAGGLSLELTAGSQAGGLPRTHGCGTRSWSCPRPGGGDADQESVCAVSGLRTAVGAPPGSRPETGMGRFRDHRQQ
ncbi:collagen alpha-1(I) chain-like, partial [Neomonachus schauinslandi]|uniref:Collagen alpha-1(I) chain-like n=1 Tax=Neomonachus schauinslandi TaxID=29088 RepID=A0A8M1M3U8_NEOSC